MQSQLLYTTDLFTSIVYTIPMFPLLVLCLSCINNRLSYVKNNHAENVNLVIYLLAHYYHYGVFMNNRIFMLLAICIFLPTQSLAYVTGKLKINSVLQSCPIQINCTSSNISSCKPSCDSSAIWGNPVSTTGLVAGSYSFKGAESPFQSDSNLSVKCIYQLSTNPAYVITLPSIQAANMQANYDKNRNWVWDSARQIAHCDIANPASCTFTEKSAVVIFNKDLPLGLITTVTGGTQIGYTIANNTYVSILTDDLLNACLSKQCNIYLAGANKREAYGYITIDMDNNGKLINISPSKPDKVTVTQIESYNAVAVGFNRIKNIK
jgi:hypothetical protein